MQTKLVTRTAPVFTGAMSCREIKGERVLEKEDLADPESVCAIYIYIVSPGHLRICCVITASLPLSSRVHVVLTGS